MDTRNCALIQSILRNLYNERQSLRIPVKYSSIYFLSQKNLLTYTHTPGGRTTNFFFRRAMVHTHLGLGSVSGAQHCKRADKAGLSIGRHSIAMGNNEPLDIIDELRTDIAALREGLNSLHGLLADAGAALVPRILAALSQGLRQIFKTLVSAGAEFTARIEVQLEKTLKVPSVWPTPKNVDSALRSWKWSVARNNQSCKTRWCRLVENADALSRRISDLLKEKNALTDALVQERQIWQMRNLLAIDFTFTARLGSPVMSRFAIQI
ncbi:hypothetical protein FB45DRAFT_859255 [Roridomyces roridus]|uniref:Uncharacterized protein n=1 Tax=Roridomyces roridus TaxID=1738132 RepID=A0AAD7CJG3_9AGAR|nr:hypothetical protein FB45DRAFT_859255 [Roridomyces roridus]